MLLASQVVCGGCQTMAVCLYDPKADDTEERRKGYKAKMKQWFSGGGRAMILDIPPAAKDASSTPPSATALNPSRSSNYRGECTRFSSEQVPGQSLQLLCGKPAI